MPSEETILYDGDCGFCGSAVGFIRNRDRDGRFRYLTLGSDEGRAALIAGGRDPAAEPALVLIDAAGLHAASDAAVRIGQQLPAPWAQAARLAALVPRPLREAAYRAVARSRFRLPG